MPTRLGQVVVLTVFVAWFAAACWLLVSGAHVTGSASVPPSFSGVAR